MPFTAEELMQMQDEVEEELKIASPEVKENIDDHAKKEEVKEEDKKGEKTEDGKAKTEEGKKEVNTDKGPDSKETEDKKEEVKKEEEKKEEDNLSDDELRELREITRKQKVELDKITKEYERLNKILKDKGLIDEEDEKLRKDQEDTARANYEKRVSALSDMVEIMKVNPRYEDIDSVVSQINFDDMITAMAKYHVSNHGGDITRTSTEIEREIWALPNPYKYMYDMIKKYHPAYATKEEKSTVKKIEETLNAAKKEGTEDKKEQKEPVKQVSSLQDLPGGGGKDNGGWTSEKIDAMDESELSTVPRDIYDKYLRGELK